jgi:hypothetical protein
MLWVVSLLLEGHRRTGVSIGIGRRARRPSSYFQIWPNRAAIAIAARVHAGIVEIGSGLVRNGIK